MTKNLQDLRAEARAEMLEHIKSSAPILDKFETTSILNKLDTLIDSVLDRVDKEIQDYVEWSNEMRGENLEKERVMLAYDMDSRFVAAKQILTNLSTLKN